MSDFVSGRSGCYQAPYQEEDVRQATRKFRLERQAILIATLVVSGRTLPPGVSGFDSVWGAISVNGATCGNQRSSNAPAEGGSRKIITASCSLLLPEGDYEIKMCPSWHNQTYNYELYANGNVSVLE